MSRRRKGGTVEIIHSSFIDLLFGAFGAFVFIMIAYVIMTMHMTPDEVKGIIDRYARANKELIATNEKIELEVKELKPIVQEYRKVKNELDKILLEFAEIRALKEDLQNRNAKLKGEIADLKNIEEEQQEKMLEQVRQIEKLQGDIKGLENGPAQLAALTEEVEKLRDRAEKAEAELVASRREEAAAEELSQNLTQAKHQNGELQTTVAKLAAEIAQYKGKLAGQAGSVHAWLKYLFLLFLYILGSELSSFMGKRENDADNRILKEDGATLVIDPEEGVYLQNGKPDTQKKMAENSKKFKKIRTLVWILLIVVVAFYLVQVMDMALTDLWIPGVGVIIFYGYLRKRFSLV